MRSRNPIRFSGQLQFILEQPNQIIFSPLWLQRLRLTRWAIPIFAVPCAWLLWQYGSLLQLSAGLGLLALVFFSCFFLQAQVAISPKSIELNKRWFTKDLSRQFACRDLLSIRICQQTRYHGNKQRHQVISLYPQLVFSRPSAGTDKHGRLSLANSLNSECFANDLEFFRFLLRLKQLTQCSLQIAPNCSKELIRHFEQFNAEPH